MSAPRKPQILVLALSAAATRGWLECGALRLPCALGRAGIRALKREGDGATPRGSFAMRIGYYRADRLRRPATSLAMARLRPDDGWCDSPSDRNYNRHVRHPYPASAEFMWRDDRLYDIVVVLGHNERPRVRGHGSAVFLHLARDGYKPTAGCIALSLRNALKLLRQVTPRCRIRIGP